MKTFPIQRVGRIPYSIAERAYQRYVQLYGSKQSLERLAERGGFGLVELGVLLRGYERRVNVAEDDQQACEVATREILKALMEEGQP